MTINEIFELESRTDLIQENNKLKCHILGTTNPDFALIAMEDATWFDLFLLYLNLE